MTVETIHDPRDYAANPDTLPPGSYIAECLSLGVKFDLEGTTWVARHPLYVTSTRVHIELMCQLSATEYSDPYAATRRAIVRAAAAMA
jgi:hypothetical protein